jgi:hypothetical protein
VSIDDLRNSAATSFEDEISMPTAQVPAAQPAVRKSRNRNFLGLTPAQRFIMALMIFILTCIVGTFCLLITQSIYFF